MTKEEVDKLMVGSLVRWRGDKDLGVVLKRSHRGITISWLGIVPNSYPTTKVGTAYEMRMEGPIENWFDNVKLIEY